MAKDQDQEMQTQEIKGIHMEALKIVAANRKIFIQVTVSLMLPVSCLFLAHSLITNRLASSHDWILANWASTTVYCISILLFTLLSSSSVVFTFAYVYSSPKEITFRMVMAAAPRICNDLLRTFMYLFLGFGIYAFLLLAIQRICGISISKTISEFVLGSVQLSLFILQLLGFYPIGATWQLACVVTMLEGIRGIEAVKRSVVLMKGNMRNAALDFFCGYVALYGLAALVFELGVVEDLGSGKIARKIAIGGSFLLLCFVLVLFVLLKQIFFYFACKEYHSEIVDKPMLARNLEGYLGDYVPLEGDGGGGEIQMEDVIVIH